MENVTPNHGHKTTSQVRVFMSPSVAVYQNFAWFYPIGNTRPRFLAEHCPSHIPCARVLLLGCGDPRHILFTVWTTSQGGEAAKNQKLLATMCDFEPSILARNTMLFRMIMDGTSSSLVWCLFYTQRINTICLKLLQECALRLLSVGECLEGWHASDFGRTFRFCDQSTYASVREIWSMYAVGRLASEKEAALVAERKSEIAPFIDNIITFDGLIVSEPVVLRPVQQAFDRTFKDYQDDGRAPSWLPSSSSEASLALNPMFLRGKAQHHFMHYGQLPHKAFHCSVALAHTLLGPLHKERATSVLTEDDNVRLMSEFCEEQFDGWCLSFRNAVEHGMVETWAHGGDAHVLCAALKTAKRQNEHGQDCTRMLDGAALEEIRLEPGIPCEYDVVDTSNIADSLGLLNVLCSVNGLLDPGPHSVLYTEVLSTTPPEDGGFEAFLEQELCGDIHSMSAIAGWLLADWYFRCTTRFSNSRRWQMPMLPGPLCLHWKPAPREAFAVVEEPQFITAMLEVYKRMFASQMMVPDWQQLRKDIGEAHRKRKGQNVYGMPSTQTFARLVECALQRLRCNNQEQALEGLVDAISRTGFLMQPCHMPELVQWFTALGFIPESRMREQARQYDKQLRLLDIGPGETAVFLTLLIPKARMSMLGPDFFKTPILTMNVRSGSDGLSVFTSVHRAYVRERLPAAAAADCSVESDSDAGNTATGSGFKLQHFMLDPGSLSDHQFVALSAFVPVACLGVHSADAVHVALSLPATMIVRCPDIIEKFGLNREVFSAPLSATHL
eukprot:3939355-Rhodomonas_salina.4